MKELIGKIWGAFVRLLSKPTYDQWLHFVFGLLAAAFFYIALGWGYWSVLPTIALAFAKEAIDKWITGQWDWRDIVAGCAGGIMIWLFLLLGAVL